jgi:hypothetical protein
MVAGDQVLRSLTFVAIRDCLRRMELPDVPRVG